MASNNEDAGTPDAPDASGDLRHGYIEVARVLAEMSRGGRYRQFKDRHGQAYVTFAHYVEDSIGWKDRKARYFVNIYERLVVGAGVKEEDLVEIDWSKASQVARLPKAVLANPKMVDKWIAKARTMGHSQLELEVNKAKNADAEKRGVGSTLRTEGRHHEVFALYEGQHKNVKRALKIAGKQTGSNKKSLLLDLICTDFIVGRAGDTPVELKQILAAVERVFDCNIGAFDKGDGLLYGGKHAKKLGDG